METLTAVLAAARCGSFSAAADDLGITHGSVSRRVQVVETWLGTAVFERHGRGVRLTPAGEHLAREVDAALARIAAVAADLRVPRAPPARLRISVLPSFARLWLLPRLAELQRKCPGVSLQLQTEHRQASFEDGTTDLAVRFGSGQWPGTEASLLMKERLFAVATPELARKLRGRGPSAVLGETLLHDSDTQHWRSWCQLAGIAFRPRRDERRFDDYDLVLAAAEAGLGIAIARWPLAAPSLESKRLVRVDRLELVGVKAHYIVIRSADRRASVRRLTETLSALAARSP
jgi:DNA-binding transcriptional LysR family regulator